MDSDSNTIMHGHIRTNEGISYCIEVQADLHQYWHDVQTAFSKINKMVKLHDCIPYGSRVLASDQPNHTRIVHLSHDTTKRVFGSFRPGQHKPACAATEAS